jgi:hypothetical protein
MNFINETVDSKLYSPVKFNKLMNSYLDVHQFFMKNDPVIEDEYTQDKNQWIQCVLKVTCEINEEVRQTTSPLLLPAHWLACQEQAVGAVSMARSKFSFLRTLSSRNNMHRPSEASTAKSGQTDRENFSDSDVSLLTDVDLDVVYSEEMMFLR